MSCDQWAESIDWNEFEVDGIRAREFSVGNLIRRQDRSVTEIGFDESEAECLSKMLLKMAGGCEGIILALYPGIPEVWERLSVSAWNELHRKEFVRRWSSPRRIPWVIGSATTAVKLAEVLHWAWTFPGRDTLLAVVGRGQDWHPLADLFEDDHEDDGENERRLVVPYPTIVSRGLRAANVRVVTREYEVQDLRAIIETQTL
jgi:hypothetical protein